MIGILRRFLGFRRQRDKSRFGASALLRTEKRRKQQYEDPTSLYTVFESRVLFGGATIRSGITITRTDVTATILETRTGGLLSWTNLTIIGSLHQRRNG